MLDADLAFTRMIGEDIDASPTPYHAVIRARERLESAGFVSYDPGSGPVGRWYHAKGGGLVAWVVSDQHDASSGLRIVGAHTDSPNLRLKPRPDTTSAGFDQLGVEIYGGVLLNSWLDRDLGLAGRVSVAGTGALEMRTFRDDRALARVPQLAIHLDRGVNDKGLILNPQRHMVPVWGLGAAPDFRAYLAEQVGVEPEMVMAWDAMFHDVAPATLAGLDEEFLASARLDNQLSCFTALSALLAVADAPGETIPMVALFDHEEVGSVSTTGAASPFLRHQIERIAAAFGADHEARLVAAARSIVISADGAHATHPNYPERHEPEHQISLNGGPVIKINANQRYATDAGGQAIVEYACRNADIPVQHFVTRTDLACGSTIGPATAGELGIAVVDVGIAQLGMHSAREMCGSADPALFARALEAVFRA